MDEYSGKRSAGGVVVPRKGSSLVLRDTADSRDGNAQICNRLGCSSRLNYMKGSQSGYSEKPKYSKPSFRSSSGKEIIGSSSRISSLVSSTRKCSHESRKKTSSQLETDSSETSSVQDEPEVPEQSEQKDAESGKVTLAEVGSSSLALTSRNRRIFQQKSGLVNKDTPPGNSISSASKSAGQWARNSSNASRYGLKNLRCNSISDILPQGCSSAESNNGRRRDNMVKKKNTEGESSSSFRGKKTSEPSLSEGGHVSLSANGITISDSRRDRNWPLSRDSGVASVRTRRSVNANNIMGLSNQVNGNNSLQTEPPFMISQVPQPEIPISMNIPSSSHQFSSEASSSRSSAYSRFGSSDDNLSSIMPMGSGELGMTHLMNRDGLRRYNMDGIAEVLLALERVEQDEDLTYEQLLALETNLFLGGLSFNDQHRDMRLDIDNMSYEELLALEEKMGTVSTALSEETLSKCLKRSIYQPIPQEEGAIGCNGDGDETKCSICQEEYVVGDEIGKLGCDHGYHGFCVNQWLRLKNWCPICKAPAAAAAAASQSP